MNTSYTVTIDNGQEFQIQHKEINDCDIIATSKSKFHVLKNSKSFNAELLEHNFLEKNYKVKVNKNTYNIHINTPLDELIKKLGFEVGISKKVNDIKAPMPGLILDISVNVGQEVKENDALLILEAMKMENVLTSPRDGTIKSITVKKGDAVEKNQLLIEFDA